MLESISLPFGDHHIEVNPGIVANEPISTFDYNGNVAFADVVWLFSKP